MGRKFKFLHKDLGLETNFCIKRIEGEQSTTDLRRYLFREHQLAHYTKKLTNSLKKTPPIKCCGVFFPKVLT